MKKILINASLLASLFITIIGCNPKNSAVSPDTNVPEDIAPRFVGTWVFVLKPMFTLVDTISLSLTVEKDSAFNITVLQRKDKTLFKSDGSWDASSDSVTLTGESCMMLDTLGDTLVAMAESDCATPITLPYPKSDSLWTIKTSSFSVALSSLPVPKATLDILLPFLQVIELQRKE